MRVDLPATPAGPFPRPGQYEPASLEMPMESPTLTAVVVPALNRKPWELEEAVELLADDGVTPLRMVLPALGFKAGQRVRIQVIEPTEPDPFSE